MLSTSANTLQTPTPWHFFWSTRLGRAVAASAAMLVFLACFPALSGAQTEGAEAPSKSAEKDSSQPPDPFGRDTPYGAVTGYLQAAASEDYARAAEYLDLSHIPQAAQQFEGPELARQFKLALDRYGWIENRELSKEAKGNLTDGLAPERDQVGYLSLDKTKTALLLEREENGETGPFWKFSSDTLAQIPALAAEIRVHPIERLLPRSLMSLRWLDVALWQWLGLLLLIFVAWFVSWLLLRAGVVMARFASRHTHTGFLEHMIDVSMRPLCLFVGVWLFALGTFLLGVSAFARQYLYRIETLLALFAIAWFILRLIDMFSDTTTRRLLSKGSISALSVVPLGRRAVKFLIIALVFFASLDALGLDVTPMLAALGVGGIAIGLAAQKTLENFFGGVALIADQPLRVGDFCRFGDKLGTIEDIGLRSTRVRTLDRTVVSVPNGEFSSLQIENFSRRDRFWFHPTLGLRYETTPDQIRVLLVEIRAMLYAHPKVTPEPSRVRFIGFGDFSLNLEVFAYVHAANYDEFLEIQEDLLLRIMEIIEAVGSAIAFPSQTLYVTQDANLDEQLRRKASDTVQHWRENQELQLPRFTPERVTEIRDSLEYPPPGSALHNNTRHEGNSR